MLVLLYTGDAIVERVLHQRMVSYANASARESDGAENRVVMNGKPGYLGYSSVYLKYLEDGWISLSGNNSEENNGWKLISEFEIEPGRYLLTGIRGASENSIALQLYISNDTGEGRYIYQWDEDMSFTVERTTKAVLHVRVYPFTEEVDLLARPAVYRDE